MRLLKADDGVSESLGFVLLAMVLMTAMAFVIMIGYPMYQESINQGHMQNMQEGFYLLSANMNKVALYESPTQSSELKLYGGTLSLHNDGAFKVTYVYANPVVGSPDITEIVAINPNHQILEYSLNNQKVAYILGGVFKKDGSSSVLLQEPIAYKYTTGTTPTIVLPLIFYSSTTTAKSDLELASSSSGLARVVVRSPFYLKSLNTIRYDQAEHIYGVKRITVETTSEYGDALGSYFKDDLFGGGLGGTVTETTDASGKVTVDWQATPGSTINLYIPYSILTVTIN